MNYNLLPVAYAVAADPFAKSPLNPLNMSRSGEKCTTGHAPSLRILERVRENAADLAVLATTPHGWKFVTEKNRAMVYEMSGRALPPGVAVAQSFGAGGGGGHASDFYLVRAVTTVHANIASVLDALHARTTDEFEPKMRLVFGKHFARGVVVDELSCTTPPPFAPDPTSDRGARRSFSDDDAYAVNWLSLHGPPSLSGADKVRDFTLVSYQDGFERQPLGNGTGTGAGLARLGRGELLDRARAASRAPAAHHHTNLLGVHVLASVNFKDVPPLPAASQCERQHLRASGFVVEATNDPYAFRLSLFLSLLPTKASLKHARKYNKWLVALAASVGNVAAAVARATPEISVAQLGRRAWKHSDHCYICLKMFRAFRRCHHCRLCGEAICSACSGFVNVSAGSGGRGRSNSHSGSSVDLRSQHSGDESASDDGRAFVAETRGCTVCLQNLTAQSGASAAALLLRRQSSSSSFSTGGGGGGSVDLAQAASNSVASLAESYGAESAISFGGDSDRMSSERNQGGGGGHPSFQSSYYDHRKRSTNAVASSSSNVDESSSAASSLLFKPHASDYSSSHHNVTSTPSMSTTSSSFSHDGDPLPQFHASLHSSSSNPDLAGWQQAQTQTQTQTQTQAPPPSPQSQPRIFSSEVSEGSDLSMDPEILALAGLTMKPSSSQYAQQQAAYSVMEEEDYDDDLDDRAAAASPLAPIPSGAQAAPASLTRSNSIGWAGTDSISSNSSSTSGPLSLPPSLRSDAAAGGATFHFSVMANTGASTAAATVPKSSVHAEIAALMLQDLVDNGPMAAGSGALSGPYGRPPAQAPPPPFPPARAPQPPPQQQYPPQHQQLYQQQPDRFYRSASAVASAPASHAVGGFNPSASAHSQSQSRAFNPSASASSNSSSHSAANAPSRMYASSKIISAAALTASHQRAAASQQQRMAAASRAPPSDMILLSKPAPKTPEFVVFDAAQRESIFTRPDDGNDMIRLDF